MAENLLRGSVRSVFVVTKITLQRMTTLNLNGTNPILNLSAALLAVAAITQITINNMAKQDLGEILKLAQVAATLQAPQQQQEQQDLATLMAMLNMQQQRSSDEARLGLSREQMQLESADRQAATSARQKEVEAQLLQQAIMGAQTPRERENLFMHGIQEGTRLNQGLRLGTATDAISPAIPKLYKDNARSPEKIAPALQAMMRDAGLQWTDAPVANLPWEQWNRETWPGAGPVPQISLMPGAENFTAAGNVGRNTVAPAVNTGVKSVMDLIPGAINSVNAVAEGALGTIGVPVNFGRMNSWYDKWNNTASQYPQTINDLIIGTDQEQQPKRPYLNRGQAAEAMKRRNQQ